MRLLLIPVILTFSPAAIQRFGLSISWCDRGKHIHRAATTAAFVMECPHAIVGGAYQDRKSDAQADHAEKNFLMRQNP
jgi:hypothetical protein